MAVVYSKQFLSFVQHFDDEVVTDPVPSGKIWVVAHMIAVQLFPEGPGFNPNLTVVDFNSGQTIWNLPGLPYNGLTYHWASRHILNVDDFLVCNMNQWSLGISGYELTLP